MKRLNAATVRSLAPEVSVPTYLDNEIGIGIVHFGVGNFHRAHQAMYLDRLLNAGGSREWGICGVGTTARDARMRDVLRDQDGLYTLTLRHPDGTDDVHVIGTIRRFLHAPDEPDAVLAQLVDPAVRIVSLTITEGAYVEDAAGAKRAEDDPLVRAETDSGLTEPRTVFGWIVAALRERRRRGIAPFTVLSCDNVPENGAVAQRSVEAVAQLVDQELTAWISTTVAFPSTMVDRITPVTVPGDVERVRRDLGIEDAWPVTAEPFEQWVVEDWFPAGRPEIASVGATLVANVAPYEAMKIRLLNGGHQAIAYVGQLAGHEYVHETMQDPDLVAFVRRYMTEDVLPTLRPPSGFDAVSYIEQLLQRFANPRIADTLARLSTDASNRIPKFVMPTIIDRLDAGAVPESGARLIASWRELARQARSSRFTLDDESAPTLMDAAAEPRAFLNALPALAPIASHQGFVAAYVAHAADLEGA